MIPGHDNNQVTICPNGECGGSENYGFNRTYTGYEFILTSFSLPADAINIALHFYATIDDRAIVDLNGNLLGGWGGIYSVAPGTTEQQLDASGYHTVAFTGPNTVSYSQAFDTQSWFIPGADNYLRFWINNTNSGIDGTATPHGGFGEPSALQTFGTITFDQGPIGAVPEPTAFVLVGFGLVGLGLASRRALRKS